MKLKRKMQFVFALASKDGNRMFGLGIDRLTGEDILVYNKGNKIRVNLSMEIYSKNIKTITCGEVSYSSKMLYFAGTMDKLATIGAVKFDQTLKPLKFQMVHESIQEITSI